MNTLVVMRHGESQHNRALAAANIDDRLNFLSLKGIEVARSAASNIRDRRFSTFFASELTRSRQTMAILLECLGYPPASNVIITPLLNEAKFSSPLVRSETDEACIARAVSFLRQYALPALQTGHVLAVSHGAFLKVVLNHIWDQNPDLGRPGYKNEHCRPYEFEPLHLSRVLGRFSSS